MIKHLKTLFITASLLLLVWFIVIVINQTYQVTLLAEKLHPSLGTVSLILLLCVYFVLLVIPFYLFLRLPSKLKMPESVDTPEHKEYITQLSRRLSTNKHIREAGIKRVNEGDLHNAISLLALKADEDIKKTASVVFISTAVSQSGKLDGFIVLIMLSKMIWRIAHIYNQRPNPREILQLYANVAGTALIAMEIEEIDIGEQVNPIINGVVGASIAGAIPGLSQISSFAFNCLMEGSINAYLTLRVGVITKAYCGSLVKPERKSLRRLASVEAGIQLGKIISSNGKTVAEKLIKGVMKKPLEKIKEAGKAATDKFRRFKKGKPSGDTEGQS